MNFPGISSDDFNICGFSWYPSSYMLKHTFYKLNVSSSFFIVVFSNCADPRHLNSLPTYVYSIYYIIIFSYNCTLLCFSHFLFFSFFSFFLMLTSNFQGFWHFWENKMLCIPPNRKGCLWSSDIFCFLYTSYLLAKKTFFILCKVYADVIFIWIM